jgi:hypothetical protein
MSFSIMFYRLLFGEEMKEPGSVAHLFEQTVDLEYSVALCEFN